MSGVQLNDACIESFNNLKRKHDKQYLLFELNDDITEIVQVAEGEKGTTYESFYTDVIEARPDEPFYCVFDFQYKDKEGKQKDKLVFLTWVPDEAKIKKKMLYTSSKDTIKKAFVGMGIEIQATSFDEADYAAVMEKCERYAR